VKRLLRPEMDVTEFRAFYWMKADLVRFARQLGLPTRGYKPELAARIERRLEGLPALTESVVEPSSAKRDSDKPLRRATPVVRYRCDAKTRAFFVSQIGLGFHFTYRLNQYRLAHRTLTYGDLVDEWIAERDRRLNSTYKPEIAQQGKYNRFIRDYFADELNRGRSLRDAAAAWNAIKTRKGDPRYRPRGRGKNG
jgi:hypothetical protein